jgi:NAD(P)-dependent dehydrogenase (short-subunit alcohol dehydrogenase family)
MLTPHSRYEHTDRLTIEFRVASTMLNEKKYLRTYQGAVAIITGGASGIGKSLGEELALRGCEVILADLQYEIAAEVAANICAKGGKASAYALDVTDPAALETLLQNTFERCQRLDYMFNNAGVALNGKFVDFELADWRNCIDINLMGVVHGTRAAHKYMSKQGFGHIINTASFAGVFPWPTTIAYTTSKHAIVGLSTALRAELADTGIRVSVVCPGTILTPMIKNGASPQRWVGTYSREKLDTFFKGASGMEPDVFAKKALDGIAKNKSIIVIPNSYKMLWWINRISPALAMQLSQQIYKAIFKRISD